MSDLVGNPEDRFSQNEAQIHSLSVLLGLVVRSIVSLTTSLRRQLFKYMWTTLFNMPLFFVFYSAKDSHFFNKK